MKRNTFYILVGIVALVEVILFWASIQMSKPMIIQAAIIIGIVLLYLARRQVTDVIEDERTSMITQKAAMRTLEIFWVVFFVVSLGSVVMSFSTPLGLNHPPPPFPQEHPDMGIFGMFQLYLLCLIIFLFVGFRMYYAHKYGEWDEDEE